MLGELVPTQVTSLIWGTVEPHRLLQARAYSLAAHPSASFYLTPRKICKLSSREFNFILGCMLSEHSHLSKNLYINVTDIASRFHMLGQVDQALQEPTADCDGIVGLQEPLIFSQNSRRGAEARHLSESAFRPSSG
jgi:hypothetical protein